MQAQKLLQVYVGLEYRTRAEDEYISAAGAMHPTS